MFLVILVTIDAIAVYWLLLNRWNVDIVMVGTAQDFRVDTEDGGRELLISDSLRQDGEQFFAKFSFMWQR